MDTQKIKTELGQRIKAFRTHNNYTQEQFCGIIDLEQSNLSNIENAKNLPDITTLFSMMENGKIEPNFLFGFFNSNLEKLEPIDYEILNLLVNLSKETKLKLKSIIELLK